MRISVTEARAQLSELVRRAEGRAGPEFPQGIARSGACLRGRKGEGRAARGAEPRFSLQQRWSARMIAADTSALPLLPIDWLAP